MTDLLYVRDLHVQLPIARDVLGRVTRHVHAVKGVSLSLPKGSTLGLVGESGSGKSTVASAIVGLAPIASGEILYQGAVLDGPGRRRLRGRIQIVFQDPRSSLNPRLHIHQLIAEPLEILRRGDARERRDRALALLQEVGLSGEFGDRFPHELSGGQRQRVAIARALASDPDLIILDEPTSALDVSIQAQVIDLLLGLQASRRVSYLFISHDIGVVRHLSDHVAVMCGGIVVEVGPVGDVLENPQSPYTRALLSAVPRIGGSRMQPTG